MPIHKVSGGFKWGEHGKTYSSKEGAIKQAQAAYANGYKEKGQSSEQKLNVIKKAHAMLSSK